MPRLVLASLICIVLTITRSTPVFSQKSAPSSHMVFDDNFDGDIIINEVRVPQGGEAMCTYYETLGWRGRGAGYAGIQVHPKAHLFIFSIWDHKDHSAPIRAVYRGPGTQTVGFGGEGTGLKSWNFDLGWTAGTWYTQVARIWPVSDHTYYGFWVRAGDTKKWTHLVTMDVAAEAVFQGGTDAFIEDWLNTGVNCRTTNLRGGWKRRTDGSWFAFQNARYSVNAWDLIPGKRSYDYRTNWDGGVGRDESGDFYFMTSGGAETRPSTTNPSKFSIERRETAPAYERIRISDLTATWKDERTVQVDWNVDARTTPQFAYRVQLVDAGIKDAAPLAATAAQVPHARSVSLRLPAPATTAGRYSVRMECTDILDRKSDTATSPVTVEEPAEEQ